MKTFSTKEKLILTNLISQNKMKWLINDLAVGEDTRDFLLIRANEIMSAYKFTTISSPTGTGKSGIIYMDIANIIRNTNFNNYVFAISTPYLKLNEQFTKDGFDTLFLSGIINSENSVCGVLSSDYCAKRGNINITGKDEFGNDIEFDTGIECMDATEALQSGKKYVFLIACHKSLYRFFKMDKLISEDSFIKVWPDESHTLKVLNVPSVF